MVLAAAAVVVVAAVVVAEVGARVGVEVEVLQGTLRVEVHEDRKVRTINVTC